LQGSAAEDDDVSFRRVLVRFTYMGAFGVLPRPLRRWSRRHLLNVVRQFDIALVAIKDPAASVDVGPERARALEQRIIELKRARTQYPDVARETEAARAARSAAPGRRGGALAPVRHRRDALL